VPYRAPRLAYERVSHRYRKGLVLDGIDLDLDVGVTALLGPNGAGKSTLLGIGAGELVPSGGHVRLLGSGSDARSTDRAYRRAIGWLPQTFSVPPQFTADEFLRYVGWLRGLPSRRLAAASRRAIELVDLEGSRNEKLRSFSGGMVRRIGIAQAIVHEPDVVLLDEPTVGLDPHQRSEFRRIIVELGQRSAVVLSTHLTDDVAMTCDRVAVLSAGRLAFVGSTIVFSDLGARPAPGETAFDAAYRVVMAE
jgi:ABC-type multidrug transport system ATPase subunit